MTKASQFCNNDLARLNWIIPAGSPITEVSRDTSVRRVMSAKLPQDILLIPENFKVITPTGNDWIPDHICFEFTNSAGAVTWVYVHETHVKIKPQTWTDVNKLNII